MKKRSAVVPQKRLPINTATGRRRFSEEEKQRLTLESFENIDVLPSKILLSGGGAHLPEIKEALESREWSKSLPFTRKPQVSFINPKMINNLVDETRLLKDQQVFYK